MRHGRARPVLLLLSVLTLVVGSLTTTTTPAVAAGGLTVEFTASGSLYPFPTPSGYTYFWGQATGAGELTGFSSGGNVTTAEFTHLTMPVSGGVEYGEAAAPLCPLVGSAASNGRITVGSPDLPGTTGITYTSGYTNTGIITGVVYSFDLTYTRVGPAATILFGIPPGTATATVYFTTPGHGADSFTVPIVAVGEAVFYADYVQATMNCVNHGGPPIAYTLTGAVSGAAA